MTELISKVLIVNLQINSFVVNIVNFRSFKQYFSKWFSRQGNVSIFNKIKNHLHSATKIIEISALNAQKNQFIKEIRSVM